MVFTTGYPRYQVARTMSLADQLVNSVRRDNGVLLTNGKWCVSVLAAYVFVYVFVYRRACLTVKHNRCRCFDGALAAAYVGLQLRCKSARKAYESRETESPCCRYPSFFFVYLPFAPLSRAVLLKSKFPSAIDESCQFIRHLFQALSFHNHHNEAEQKRLLLRRTCNAWRNRENGAGGWVGIR